MKPTDDEMATLKAIWKVQADLQALYEEWWGDEGETWKGNNSCTTMYELWKKMHDTLEDMLYTWTCREDLEEWLNKDLPF